MRKTERVGLWATVHLAPAAALLGLLAAHGAAAQEPAAAGLEAIQPIEPPPFEAAGDAQRVDLYGDPLPRGAVARLGTIRYRHPGWYKRIEVLPDNTTLIVGTRDNTVRFWDALSGRPVREIALADATLQTFCLSRDGGFLVVLAAVLNRQTRESQMRLKVWETATWNERAALEWIEPLIESSQCAALLPDAALVAIGTRSGQLRFWDLDSGEELLSYKALQGEIESIDFSPDGQWIAAAGRHGALLWEWASTNDPIALADLPRGGQAVRFSPDGALLAVGSSNSNAAQLYDVPSGKLNRRLHGRGQYYYREGLAFAQDGRQLVIPSPEKSLEFFDVATGEIVRTLDTGSEQPRDVGISSDERLAAFVGSQSEVKVWDLQAGELLSDRFIGHAEPPQEIHFLPGGERIATAASDGAIRIWDRESGEQQRILELDRWVVALAVSRDGSRLLSSSLDDAVRLWDAESGQEIYRLAGHGTTGGSSSSAVAFSDDETTLLSFGSDLYLRLFDVATGKAIAEHAIHPTGLELEETEDGTLQFKGDEDPFGGITTVLGSARFSADGKNLYLATRSRTLHLFDVASGHELVVFEPEEPFRQFAMANNGAVLATVRDEPRGDPAADPPERRAILQLRPFPYLEPLWTRELAGGFRWRMTFSPDAALLAVNLYGRSPVAGSRSWISIYATATGEELYRIEEFPHNANHFAFSPDTRHLAASYTDTTVLLWDLEQFRVAGGEAKKE